MSKQKYVVEVVAEGVGPLPEARVTFLVDGQRAGDVLTGADGQASVEIEDGHKLSVVVECGAMMWAAAFDGVVHPLRVDVGKLPAWVPPPHFLQPVARCANGAVGRPCVTCKLSDGTPIKICG